MASLHLVPTRLESGWKNGSLLRDALAALQCSGVSAEGVAQYGARRPLAASASGGGKE